MGMMLHMARCRPLVFGVFCGAMVIILILIYDKSHDSDLIRFPTSNLSLHLPHPTRKNISYLPECKTPVKNVYYVKVHKTASSTMITILYGLARRHNMTVYPVSNDPYPGTMSANGFRKPKEYSGMGFNVFGEHAVFDERVAQRLMPAGTRYIATIRYPVTQIRSLFVEFGLTLPDSQGRPLSSTESAELYLSDPERYQTNANTILKNFQSRYLSYEKKEDVQEFIYRIEKKLSLILIAEYFDESLVILRRKLCWDFHDIIYTVLRKRVYKNKHNIPSDSQLVNHQRASHVDYEVYNYFMGTLLHHIAAQGESFHDELFMFKTIKENVYLFCDGVVERLGANSSAIRTMVSSGEEEWYNPGPWGSPFSITAVDCALMKLRTRVHRNIMKIRQFPELCRYPRLPAAIAEDITWSKDGSHVVMNNAFCGSHDSSGIPLDVLELPQSYMWT